MFKKQKLVFRKKQLVFRKDKLVYRKEQVVFRKDKLVYRKDKLVFRKDKPIFRKENSYLGRKYLVSQRSVMFLREVLCLSKKSCAFACIFCVCQLRWTFGSLLGA